MGSRSNAIARELDVSGPALYRYFAGRDELLTALIIDAYEDLARALPIGVTPRRGRSADALLRLLTRAYRQWALDQPHRYRCCSARRYRATTRTRTPSSTPPSKR